MGARGPKPSWTPEQDETLRVLWPTDIQTVDIAARIGKSKNAILGRKDRLGLPERRVKRIEAWSDIEIEILKDGSARGLSAGAMAAKLPAKSRLAVVGKCSRLGLLLGGTKSHESQMILSASRKKVWAERKAAAPEVKKSHEAERITAKQTHAGKGSGDAPHYTPKTDDSAGKKTLVELDASDCRFLCDGNGLFCAEPKDGTSSYCSAHHVRCSTAMPPRSRKDADKRIAWLGSR